VPWDLTGLTSGSFGVVPLHARVGLWKRRVRRMQGLTGVGRGANTVESLSQRLTAHSVAIKLEALGADDSVLPPLPACTTLITLASVASMQMGFSKGVSPVCCVLLPCARPYLVPCFLLLTCVFVPLRRCACEQKSVVTRANTRENCEEGQRQGIVVTRGNTRRCGRFQSPSS